jgi:hypothetical protein
MLLVKIIVEMAFLMPVARFFKEDKALRYFPFLQPLHIIYVVLAGFLGLAFQSWWAFAAFLLGLLGLHVWGGSIRLARR